MILVIYTSHTNSRPFLVTAAFCVRPVDTWVTWVSLLGRGSFTGEDTPIPQKKTELRAGGLADSASTTGTNKIMMKWDRSKYMYARQVCTIIRYV